MATSGSVKLRTFLLANAGVSAIVGTNVITPRAVAEILFPSIVFRVVGGPSMGDNTLRRQSFEFRCWADTELGAFALHEALRTAMLGDPTDQAAYRAAMRVAGLVRATEEIEGQILYDPNTKDKAMPFMLGNYSVVFHDE